MRRYEVRFGDPPSTPFGPFCRLHAEGFSRLAQLSHLADWTLDDAEDCVWCHAQASGRPVFAEPIDKHGRPITPTVLT